MFGKKNKKTKQEKPRRMSIRLKILVPTTVLLVAVCALLGYNSYSSFQKNLLDMGVGGRCDFGISGWRCSGNSQKRV